MGALARVLRLAIVLALVAVVALATIVGAITLRSLPQTSGTVRVPGLEGDATILRDDNGIVRILADSPHDLFLAQGYVHAQERLWQMEVWRHLSAGRLSELFGESTLEADRFIRTLDWRGSAARDLESFSPATRAVLDAYAEGVNAFIETHRGSLGLAFVVTALRTGTGGLGGYDLEPWTALDSAAWQKAQSWNLGDNFRTEIFRMIADERLGDPARTDDLFPAYGVDAPVIVPSVTGASEPSRLAAREAGPSATAASPARPTMTEREALAWRRLATVARDVARLAGLDSGGSLVGSGGIGSNSWVLAPERSATGGALFGNDPHLGLGMPSVWFINGLHCRTVSDACPYDVAGVSFPGTPAVVLGHNARIAWGATNAGPDVQDLVIEQLDPADPTAYLDGTASVPLDVRVEEIRVAGAEPVRVEVRSTRHGPILNDVVPALADAPPMAIRWTATLEPDGTLEAILGVNTAGTFEEFRQALRGYGSPAQNFVYADIDGHIGYQLPGYIPVRADGSTGERPVPAGVGEWTGRIPFDELPTLFDPAGGVIVAANNAVVDGDYPYLISRLWDYGERAGRIRAVIDGIAEGTVTREHLRTLQVDTHVARADRLVLGLDGVEARTDDGRELLRFVREWDRGCDVESRGCTAFMSLEFRLAGRVFDDELGSLARDYVGSAPGRERLGRLMSEPDSPWWDDVGTTRVVEAARETMTAAVDETGRELREALGAPADWTWGRLHRLVLREDTLGTSGIVPLEWYFNAPPRPAPGAAGTVNNLYYRTARAYPDPEDRDHRPVGIDRVFEVTNGPSYRLLVDMSDLDGATIIQSTGQSGNPFDRHYGDYVERWLAGEALGLPWDREAVRGSATSVLRLER